MKLATHYRKSTARIREFLIKYEKSKSEKQFDFHLESIANDMSSEKAARLVICAVNMLPITPPVVACSYYGASDETLVTKYELPIAINRYIQNEFPVNLFGESKYFKDLTDDELNQFCLVK